MAGAWLMPGLVVRVIETRLASHLRMPQISEAPRIARQTDDCVRFMTRPSLSQGQMPDLHRRATVQGV